MLIYTSGQMLTLQGPPQRGVNLGSLGIIENSAIWIEDGIISEIGSKETMKTKFKGEKFIDVGNKVIMPGFVDAHTHVIWAGDRAGEFEERLEGKSYLDILQEGGGINATVTATRMAGEETLSAETEKRLWKLLAHGTTTIEAKTGYGLEIATEMKMLTSLIELDRNGPWDLAITFLGAHAIPKEYNGREDEFTKLVIDEMLPTVKEWWLLNCPDKPLPFADVFCETGAFTLEQSHAILKEAKNLGFPIKIHADEFDNLGGTAMAVSLGAVSADHLIAASQEDIYLLAKSDTVAVALPGTPFGLGLSEYAPAQKIIKANGLLAVASDLNPGTSWCENIQMALALACRYMKLTPAQAIASATINGAAAIGREDQVGSLEVGKQADILILEVSDYRHLGYRYGTNLVEKVIKNGIEQKFQ
jgi:imidazolonepropionase